MVTIYKCDKCNKVFNHKNDYRRHSNRKYPCFLPKKILPNFESPKIDDDNDSTLSTIHNNIESCSPKNFDPHKTLNIPHNILTNCLIEKDKDNTISNSQMIVSNTFKCNNCNREFTRSDNLERHKAKYCHKKIKNDSENNELEILKKMVIELQEKLNINNTNANSVVNGNVSNVGNVNNNVTTNQIINNDIKMIAFGKEDLYELLTDDEAIKYLSKGYQSVYKLIEDTHFNPTKPKFHNVFISDKNRQDAMIYNGENWDTLEKTDVVDQLFDDKACYLTAMFKELKHKLDKKVIDKYSKFINDTDEETMQNLKKDVKQLLYNKRHIPMKTKKLMK